MSSFLCVISALHFCFCILLLVGFSLTLNQCALAQIPLSSLAVVLLTCEQRWALLVRLSCVVLISPFVLNVNVLFAVERCPLVCAFLFHIVLKVEFLLLKGTVKVLKPEHFWESFWLAATQFCPYSSDWTSRSSLGCRSGTSRCVIFTVLGWRPLVAVGPGCRAFWWKRFPPQLGLNDLKRLLLISSLRFALLPSSTTSLRVEKGSSVSLLCN